MKKRRYRRLFAVLTAAMFSACNVTLRACDATAGTHGRLSGLQYKAG